MCTNTLMAKTKYHQLVTNLLKEHIETQRLHNASTTMCLERRRWYAQAKHDTIGHYTDIKAAHHLQERYKKLCTDADVLLAHHERQALYTWLQHERIVKMALDAASCYRKKTALYWDASRQARQTIYMIRKRPREQ